MADENITDESIDNSDITDGAGELDDGIKDENQVDDNQVAEGNEETEQKENILDKIGNKIKNFFNGNTETDDSGEAINQEVDIPDEFYQVMSSKFSDDEIMDFVTNEKGELKYKPEELMEMVSSLKSEESESVKSEEKSEQTPTDDKGEDKTESKDDEIEALKKEIAELKKVQGIDKESKEKKDFDNFVETATGMMDEASKQIPALGTMETLPTFPDGSIVMSSPQMKARCEVFDIAQKLKAGGIDEKTAIQISINAFKGKNLETDVKRNVLQSLKDNRKRLSPKQVGHEKTETKVTGPDIITEVGRRHGVEIS